MSEIECKPSTAVVTLDDKQICFICKIDTRECCITSECHSSYVIDHLKELSGKSGRLRIVFEDEDDCYVAYSEVISFDKSVDICLDVNKSLCKLNLSFKKQ